MSPGPQLLTLSSPRKDTIYGKFQTSSFKHLLALSSLVVYIGHFQSPLLCHISGNSVPYWGEGEISGGITESGVRVLPPPIIRVPGVLHQEGLWPARKAV